MAHGKYTAVGTLTLLQCSSPSPELMMECHPDHRWKSILDRGPSAFSWVSRGQDSHEVVPELEV